MNLNRPLIGIVPDYKEGCSESYSAANYYALRTNYVDMVNKSGGAAILLTFDYGLIDFYLKELDGLMIVGGDLDINPKRYGEKEIHPTVKLNEVRESFELALGSKAMKMDIPLLGICSGMQLINVLHGGKAIQHIPDEEGDFMQHEQSHIEGFTDYRTLYHDVNIDKNSKLFSMIGEEKIKTNSSHHQATRIAGEGFEISARASDGIIEAIEKVDHPFCLGVQWHPEFGTGKADQKIFDGFVNAAQQYKKGK